MSLAPVPRRGGATDATIATTATSTQVGRTETLTTTSTLSQVTAQPVEEKTEVHLKAS